MGDYISDRRRADEEGGMSIAVAYVAGAASYLIFRFCRGYFIGLRKGRKR